LSPTSPRSRAFNVAMPQSPTIQNPTHGKIEEPHKRSS
jgi:hypothetical protein